MDVGRSLVKLTIGGGCVLGALATTAIVGPVGGIFARHSA